MGCKCAAKDYSWEEFDNTSRFIMRVYTLVSLGENRKCENGRKCVIRDLQCVIRDLTIEIFVFL